MLKQRLLVLGVVAVTLLALAGEGQVAAARTGRASQQSAGPRQLVVIDPGHGGKDPGAHSRRGLLEKKIALAIARDLVAALRRQSGDRVRVVMTRQDDRFIELDRRVQIANDGHAALLVSIHCDAHASPAMRGYSILYAQAGGPQAAQAAAKIARRLTAAGITQRTVRRDYRGLEVLDGTSGPAVLIETGFLTNAREAARLADPAYQRKLANAAAQGILDSLR